MAAGLDVKQVVRHTLRIRALQVESFLKFLRRNYTVITHTHEIHMLLEAANKQTL
jgi:hypothetical protein